MDPSLTSEELAEIERRERAATPGPWESGVRYERFGVNPGLRPGEGPYSFLPEGRCFHCAETCEPPLGIERDRYGTVFHVHRILVETRRPASGWHAISSAATRELVVESYEGLVSAGIRPHDAEFIAHARRDVPRLVAEIRRLRASLERMEELQRALRGVEETTRGIRAVNARLREQQSGALEVLRRTRAAGDRMVAAGGSERTRPLEGASD